MISLYWTVTTITTVGYGDISGTNNYERAFCSVVMIVGVFAFSYANGAFTSLLSNVDTHSIEIAAKNEILKKIDK